jgi:ABC-type ATPase involved in cell division
MAELVFVIGRSGTGKSTSIRNLKPEETVIINSDQKALPFRKFKELYNEEKGNAF